MRRENRLNDPQATNLNSEAQARIGKPVLIPTLNPGNSGRGKDKLKIKNEHTISPSKQKKRQPGGLHFLFIASWQYVYVLAHDVLLADLQFIL